MITDTMVVCTNSGVSVVVTPRLVMLPQLSPAIALTGVVLAPCTYPSGRKLNDIGTVIGVSVPRTLLKNPPVALPGPSTLAQDRDLMSRNPLTEIKTFMPKFHPTTALGERSNRGPHAGYVSRWLHAGHVFQQLHIYYLHTATSIGTFSIVERR